ncbi:MAG: hypothetical protein ACE5G6_07630, partial [Terriglobia bacterium]
MTRTVLALLLFLALSLPAAAQNPATTDALITLAELPGVSGYEEQVTAWLAERLKDFHPQVDNLGTVTVTLGSGAPHRLLVTHIDEPGYVVSAIREDGFLQVQRLPQRGVHPWFELMHSAQPIQILTRDGQLVPGVVAGLSVHLHRDRASIAASRTDDLERIYIDVGARSPEEVRALGVDLLDPLTLEKRAYRLANSEVTAPFVSDRFGAAALVRLLERIDPAQLQGTLTVAFVVRRYMGNQGLDRLLRRIEADEVIFLERLAKSDARPGDGVLVAGFEGSETDLAAALWRLARENEISVRPELSEPPPRGRYTGRRPLPARAAVLGVPVWFPQTPAEVIGLEEVAHLGDLLGLYLGIPPAKTSTFPPIELVVDEPVPPTVENILAELAEVYGVSGYEEPVVEEIKELLPEWAREWATVDARGNLIVPFGRENPEKPRLVFVAHMDEIGWVVREIREDGRLVLARRGGFLEEHFLGHAVFVHTAAGKVPAVIELPEEYRSQRYRAVRGREHLAYTGARTREEAEALGIRVGDSVTVPKKFRRLAGTRVSARSFDDRVGSTALVAALWEIDPAAIDREVIFVWSVEEEI